MNYYLYIDDIREDLSFIKKIPKIDDDFPWTPIILRSYKQVKDFLINYYDCETDSIFLDLDHDLGDLDADNDGEFNPNALSGYDICKLIVNSSPIHVYGFHIHSMNPVGAQNMRNILKDYGMNEYI